MSPKHVRNPKIHPEHIPRKRENIHELAADYTLRSLRVLCVSAVSSFLRFFLPQRRRGRRDYAEINKNTPLFLCFVVASARIPLLF